MDEKEQNINESPNIKVGTKFSAWLDNYWYHYKWHTIAALFVIFIVTICTVQTCSRTEMDIQIMYAGNDDIKMLSGGEELSEYEVLMKAVRRFVPDRDGDGGRNVALLTLFLPSDKRVAELKEELGKGYELNYTLINDNSETFDANIVYGDYYICILSSHLLDKKTVSDEANNPFVKITHYLPEGAEYSYGAENSDTGGYVLHSDYGVYLSSTPLADNPGFSELSADTVIAMRKFSDVTSAFSTSKSEDYFRYTEDVLRRMLKDEAYE